MKGFALAVVLFFMAVCAALAVGGVFVARSQAAAHRTISRGARLDGLAEEWAARSIAEWDSITSAAVGATTMLPEIAAGATRVSRWITRTDSSVYWIMVQVTVTDKPLLGRRLGATVMRSGNGLLLPPGWGWIDLP